MQKEHASITVSNGNWILKNQQLRITVSQSTGQITSVHNGRELLSSPTETTITDKTTTNASPTKSDGIAQSNQKSVNRDVVLEYQMSFGQQDSAKCTITMSSDAFRWDVELSTKSGADREAYITYKLPILQKFDEVSGQPLAALTRYRAYELKLWNIARRHSFHGAAYTAGSPTTGYR